MNLLLVGVRTDGLRAVGRCRFDAAADGTPLTVQGTPASVAIPDGVTRVHVTATPDTPALWAQEIALEVADDGDLTLVAPDVGLPPATLQGLEAFGHRLHVLIIEVSRVRDAGDDARDALGRIPDPDRVRPDTRRDRQAERDVLRSLPQWPPDTWRPPRADVRVVDAATPLDGGRILTRVASIDPEVDSFVLEVAGVDAPRLVAVHWPRSLSPAETAEPPGMLVYWRPGVSQRVEQGYYAGPGLEPYPFAYDYVQYGLHQYQRVGADAYLDPFPKGVPYQVAASGRPWVTVLPCNAVGAEFGAFMDAASLWTVLQAIRREMHRRVGVAWPPEDRTECPVAFAGFSSGVPRMCAFLDRVANRSHRLCQLALRSVMLFDPPDSLVDPCVRQAVAWVDGPGDGAGRCVRLYTRNASQAHARLLGRDPPAAPFVETTRDGRFTAASLPLATWAATLQAAGFTLPARPKDALQAVHQLMATLLLTHALSAAP